MVGCSARAIVSPGRSTNADTDAQDLFVETVDPSDPTQYLTPDGAKPFLIHDETIHVKDAPTSSCISARPARAGEFHVDSDLAALAGPGKTIALAFTGLGDRDTTAEALMRVNAARTGASSSMRAKLYQTPTQNFAYADIDGDIGFISPGLLPIRKSGDGLAPVDGASGAADWTGVMAFDQAPQIHNPDAGFIFNANNAIVTPDKAAEYGRDWEETFRARRIQQFFDANPKLSLDLSAAMQADHLTLDAGELLPLLERATPSDERARQAMALLSAWNGVMDKDRPEPLIYTAFLRALHRIVLVEKTGLSMKEKGPFAAETLISLLTEHPQWCDAPDKPDPDCRATLDARARRGAGRARCGATAPDMQRNGAGARSMSRSTCSTTVYSHIPLLDRVSDLSMPSSGGLSTLDRGGGFDAALQPALRPHPRRRLSRNLRIPPTPTSRASSSPPANSAIFSRRTTAISAPLWIEGKAITLAGDEATLKRAGALAGIVHAAITPNSAQSLTQREFVATTGPVASAAGRP